MILLSFCCCFVLFHFYDDDDDPLWHHEGVTSFSLWASVRGIEEVGDGDTMKLPCLPPWRELWRSSEY